MIEQVLKNYIGTGDQVLLALSGGPDSVFLFHELRTAREELGFCLSCAHLHHSLREEADGDMAFVETLCKEYDVPLYTRKVDIPAVAKREKLTIEEAGRKERYAFFYELAGNSGIIAMGHHKQDQVETILMRIIRGTGLYGLSGMKVREGQLFRPMLSLTKEEILAYLDARGYEYCIDHTNALPLYRRNEMRLSLIPSLRSYNPKVEDAIAQLGAQAGEVEAYFQEMGDLFLKEQANKKGSALSIPLGPLEALHPALRHRIYFYSLDAIGTSRQNVTSVHIHDLDVLMEKQTGTKLDLPGGTVARISYGNLIFSREESPPALPEGPLREGVSIFGEFRILVTTEIPSPIGLSDLSGVEIRCRRDGDRITIPSGHKKVKNLFIDGKVDRERRDRWPIFEDRGEIFYIPGLYTNHEYVEKQEPIFYLHVEEIE